MKNKQKILNELKTKLVETFGENIVHVILFGSQATGKAHQFSDYDILIVLKDDYDWKYAKQIRYACYDIAIDFEILFDISILSQNELNQTLRGKTTDFFKCNRERSLRMSINAEERKILITYRIEQAKNSTEDVNFQISGKKWNIAVNRIYYGMYYSVTALALLYKFETSKHNQLIGWFNKNFIHKNIFEKWQGKLLIDAFEYRQKGDYEPFVIFEEEEVYEMFVKMQEFIQIVENHILDNINKIV